MSAFLVGLTLGVLGGFHCITMCGPIAAFLHNKSNLKTSTLLYNTGRLVTYILLGALVGLLGERLAIFGYQQSISIISGTFILLFVLIPQLSKLTNKLGTANYIIVSLRDKLLNVTKTKSPTAYLGLGMLNGLLPCGLVYMALVSSFNATGLVSSISLMAGFGLGTWPLMSIMMIGGGAIFKKLRVRRLIPTLTVIIGLFLIVRGMALDIPYLSPLIGSLGWDAGITTCN